MDPVPHRRANASRAGYLTAWTLGANAVGLFEDVSMGAERSVQVTGAFGTAIVIIEGSNDGETFHPLTNPDGLTLSFRRPDLSAIREYCRYLRPRTSQPASHPAMPQEDALITVTLMIRVER